MHIADQFTQSITFNLLSDVHNIIRSKRGLLPRQFDPQKFATDREIGPRQEYRRSGRINLLAPLKHGGTTRMGRYRPILTPGKANGALQDGRPYLPLSGLKGR